MIVELITSFTSAATVTVLIYSQITINRRWKRDRESEETRWQNARDNEHERWERAELKRDGERAEERKRWSQDQASENERWLHDRNQMKSETDQREQRWLADRQIAARLDMVSQIHESIQKCLDISNTIKHYIEDPTMDMTSRIAWARTRQNEIVQLQTKFLGLTSYMPREEAKKHMLVVAEVTKWMISLYADVSDRNVTNSDAVAAFEMKVPGMAEKFVPVITVLNELSAPASLRAYYRSFEHGEHSQIDAVRASMLGSTLLTADAASDSTSGKVSEHSHESS